MPPSNYGLTLFSQPVTFGTDCPLAVSTACPLTKLGLGQKLRVSHIRKFGCLVYRHIIKKSVGQKLGRKPMKGYLVGYESTGIYRICHPEVNTIKDVIFCEDEFINIRRRKSTDNLIKSDDSDTDIEANTNNPDDDINFIIFGAKRRGVPNYSSRNCGPTTSRTH